MTLRPPGTPPCVLGAHFLLAVYLLLAENLALACLPREYEHNKICCPMCERGYFVKAPCTRESGSSACVICEDNTYMDQPSGYDKCFRCKDCDLGSGLIVKEKCTTTSNTICQCMDNHFCLNQVCDFCHEHTQCRPGEYTRKPGTRRNDTVCEKCPQGHFSNESNSAVCSPWSKCSSLGLVLDKEGTSTTDSLCKERRRHEFILLAFLPPIIFIALIIKYCTGPMKPERKEMLTAPVCSIEYPLSEEERGITEFSMENRQLERT